MKELKKLLATLRAIGVEESMSLYRQKIIHIFNVLCLIGFVAAMIQFLGYYPIDRIAAYCHFGWGLIALLCLPLHRRYGFHFVRLLLCTSIFIGGGYASARLGSETYAHFGILGIYIAIFIYFDVRKEWGYMLFYFLLAAAFLIIIDSNVLKVATFQPEQIIITRVATLIGTLLFISVEIVFLMQASWLNENSVSEKLRKNNEELRQLNQEKTILLQEIHHRVKNNFQIISSLLKLQAAEVHDKNVEYAFDEAIQRIAAFSQLHEQLYKSECGTSINLQDYLSRLASSIIEHHGKNKMIYADVQCEVLDLPNDYVVPLALIFNELLSNSLKHAFRNRPGGAIEVRIQRISAERFAFSYADDGEWKIPEDNYSFGMELVETLTEQLDGVCTRTISEVGTSYSFEMALPVKSLV